MIGRVSWWEHHQLGQLGGQRRERLPGDEHGRPRVGCLDPVDRIELRADRRRAGRVEQPLDRETDAGGVERLTVVERDAGAKAKAPRPLVERFPRLGEGRYEVPVGVERHQGVVDRAVGARLDQPGFEERVQAGRICRLGDDQPVRHGGRRGNRLGPG
jgi:hypothetical protein